MLGVLLMFLRSIVMIKGRLVGVIIGGLSEGLWRNLKIFFNVYVVVFLMWLFIFFIVFNMKLSVRFIRGVSLFKEGFLRMELKVYVVVLWYF